MTIFYLLCYAVVKCLTNYAQYYAHFISLCWSVCALITTMLMYTKYTSLHNIQYLTFYVSYSSSVNCIIFPIVCCTNKKLLKFKDVWSIWVAIIENSTMVEPTYWRWVFPCMKIESCMAKPYVPHAQRCYWLQYNCSATWDFALDKLPLGDGKRVLTSRLKYPFPHQVFIEKIWNGYTGNYEVV